MIDCRKISLTAISVLAFALAGCGPDDAAPGIRDQLALTDALGPYDYAFDEGGFPEAGESFLPEALPMLAREQASYQSAPSWDYDRGGYTSYYGDEASNDFGYYDAGYVDQNDGYGDEYYSDSSDSDQYAWLALAAMIGTVIGDSPPDYGYRYDDVQPWAWRTNDGYYRYAEPVRGGYRYYYYEPRATRPFLVRDPSYSYGYRDDRLMVIYDRDGRVLRRDRAQRQRRAASHYFDRGGSLYRAAHDGRRRGVSAPLWAKRKHTIIAEQRQWVRARNQRPAWQRWDRSHERVTERRWKDERAARRDANKRFERWQTASFEGDAPRLYSDEDRSRARIQRAGLVRSERDRRDRRVQDNRVALSGHAGFDRADRPGVNRRGVRQAQSEQRQRDAARGDVGKRRAAVASQERRSDDSRSERNSARIDRANRDERQLSRQRNVRPVDRRQRSQPERQLQTEVQSVRTQSQRKSAARQSRQAANSEVRQVKNTGHARQRRPEHQQAERQQQRRAQEDRQERRQAQAEQRERQQERRAQADRQERQQAQAEQRQRAERPAQQRARAENQQRGRQNAEARQSQRADRGNRGKRGG